VLICDYRGDGPDSNLIRLQGSSPCVHDLQF
jgi:hypothetical protein